MCICAREYVNRARVCEIVACVQCRQQQQINAMMSTISILRTEVADKLDRSSLADVLADKHREDKRDFAKKKEVDGLKQAIADVSADLERKPTRAYMDECLRTKVNKSESLAAFLKTNKDLQLPLSAEIAELKSRFTVMNTQLSEMYTETVSKCARSDDLAVLRSQVDHLFSVNAELPTKEYITTQIDSKVSLV
jgi:ABC-type phosphate transport system auxiliary subunit